MAVLRERVYAYRLSRTVLHRDDKVLTAWNGMMIAGLSKAYRVLGDPEYLRAAQSARLFLKTRLTQPDGRLWLRWRDREPAVDGQLDDYAFYIWGLLELYQAGFSTSCLREAVHLADRMAERFRDKARGGYFRTAAGSEELIVRQKDSFDGGTPSGGAAAGLVLARLARLTGEERFDQLAREQLAWLAGEAGDYPAAHCFSLLAMLEALYPGRELICVSSGGVPGIVAAAVAGSIAYRFLYAVILKTAVVPIECLKLVTAVVVALAIASPALKEWGLLEKRRLGSMQKGGR